MCNKRGASYSWANKKVELDFLPLSGARKSRKLGEFPSLLYPTSSFKSRVHYILSSFRHNRKQLIFQWKFTLQNAGI